MKNGEIYSLFAVINKLEQDNSLKFKIKVAYALAKNKESLREDAKIVYDLKQQILTKYGHKDENGDIIIAQDNISKVNEEINELMELEIEKNIIKVSIDDFNEEEISIDDMQNLMPMIEEKPGI